MDRGAWRATVHWVAKSQTQLSNSKLHFTYFLTQDPLAFHPRLQKELLSSIMLCKKVNLFFHQNINEGCFICLIFAFTCTFHKCKYLSSFFFPKTIYLFIFIYLFWSIMDTGYLSLALLYESNRPNDSKHNFT